MPQLGEHFAVTSRPVVRVGFELESAWAGSTCTRSGHRFGVEARDHNSPQSCDRCGVRRHVLSCLRTDQQLSTSSVRDGHGRGGVVALCVPFDLMNYPKWAAVDGPMIEITASEWSIQTPFGQRIVSFSEPNIFGVLDLAVFAEGEERIVMSMPVAGVAPNARVAA